MTHSLYVTSQKPPPPTLASGENEADGQGPRGGREGAQRIQGSGDPTEGVGVCTAGGSEKLLTRADALGDKLQASSPLSSHSLERHMNIYLGNGKVN